MHSACHNCYNLTGSPACGNNVTTMYYAYANCYNLTGSPVCGDNVTNMGGAYANCIALALHAFYINSTSVSGMYYTFNGKSNFCRIFVPKNSITENTIRNEWSIMNY